VKPARLSSRTTRALEQSSTLRLATSRLAISSPSAVSQLAERIEAEVLRVAVAAFQPTLAVHSPIRDDRGTLESFGAEQLQR
jgi:hypothetical protein